MSCMFPMEQKYVTCLINHMLQNHFHDQDEMAAALKLSPNEMAEITPPDLAARLFKYCAVNQICLDSVIMQIAR